MRGLNLKEIMSKSNMNQQGLNIATYGQAYSGSAVMRSRTGTEVRFPLSIRCQGKKNGAV